MWEAVAVRRALLVTVILALACGASRAEGGRSVVLIGGGGAVCADGHDVIWGTYDDAKVWRWHRDDGVVSEIEIPNLDPKIYYRGVRGCLVRPNGIDLYFDEEHVVEGAKPTNGVYNADDYRTRTVAMVDGRRHVVLDQHISESGGEEQIRFFPALGVGLRDDLTLERYSDDLKYKVKTPTDSHLLGAWSVSRDGRADPPELVVCYAFPAEQTKEGGCVVINVGAGAMQQRDISVENSFIYQMNEEWGLYQSWREADSYCGLKGPTSKGNEWPRRARFDCRKDPKGRGFGVRYPVANGYVVWETLLPSLKNVCRQRSVGEDQYIVQVQCFEIAGDALLSALPNGLSGLGYEYPAESQWTVTLFVPETNRPITGHLVSTDD